MARDHETVRELNALKLRVAAMEEALAKMGKVENNPPTPRPATPAPAADSKTAMESWKTQR